MSLTREQWINARARALANQGMGLTAARLQAVRDYNSPEFKRAPGDFLIAGPKS